MATICKESLTVTTSDGTSGTGSFYINYSISDSADRAVINSSAVVSALVNRRGTSIGIPHCEASNNSSTSGWYVNGNQYLITDTSTEAQSTSVGTTATATLASAQTTIYKTHTTQNITVSTSFRLLTFVRGNSSNAGYKTCASTATISISPKTSYTVSYNLNGGTGTIPSQTKWYGETLTLTTAKPTKSGYTFKGWATTLANAQTGNANQGATYTANAGITLYAVWELIYSKPIIQNVTVERCLQDGSEDDEGDYASVYFEWKVFKSSLARYYGGNTYPYANNSVSNCTITVGTQTLTPTLSVAEGSDAFVVGSGTFELDTAYDATISITDSQTIVANHTTTAGGTLPTAFFPMDFNADASAVGFFMSAPDAGDGAYFGKDVHIFVDTSTATAPDGDITQALTTLGWTDVLS